MDYSRHYDQLIERARSRSLTGYAEKHRIVPGCMGGTYVKSNVVRLTPEEHYVAHQLLIKIYPDNERLVYAALMMAVESKRHSRSKNKRYGWLKRKYQKVCRMRTGEKSSSYGKAWYYCPDTYQNAKCAPGNEPDGWVRGRKIKPPIKSICKACGEEFERTYRYKPQKFCSVSCGASQPRSPMSKEQKDLLSRIKTGTGRGKKNSQHGTKWMTNGTATMKVREEEIQSYLDSGWYLGRTNALVYPHASNV